MNIHEIILQLVKTDKIFKDSAIGELLPIDKVLPGYVSIIEGECKFQFNPHEDYEDPYTLEINIDDNDERVEKLESLNSDIRNYNKWVYEKDLKTKSKLYQKLEEFETWRLLVVNTKSLLLKRDNEDRLRSINCKELFSLKMTLLEDEFVKQFNKILFNYIRSKVKKAKELDAWDEGNIWNQPSKEFVHWFDIHGIEHDSILPSNQPDEDEEYYSKRGCTKAQLLYIKLFKLTEEYIKHHPRTTDGKKMSIRKSVKIVYSENKDKFPKWADRSLNKLYHEGLKLTISI